MTGGIAATPWRLGANTRLRFEASPAVMAGLVAVAAAVRAAVFFNLSIGGADGVWLLADLSAALCLAGWGLARVWSDRSDGTGYLLQAAALAWAVAALCEMGALRSEAWAPFGTATADVQVVAHLFARALLVAALIIVLPDREADGFLRRGPGVAALAGLTVVVGVALTVQPAHSVLSRTPYGFGNRTWVEAGNDVPPIVTAVLLLVEAGALIALHRTRRGLPPTSFQILGWGLVAVALPLALPQILERLPEAAPDLLAVVVFPALPVVAVVAVLRATAALGRTVARLRRAQHLMVEAVESERRRLRQELHDGLGPALAGIALGVRAAGSAVAAQAPATAQLLGRLADETEASLEEVRRIVYDLRPPALDQLGLRGAVVAHAERCCAAPDAPELHTDIATLPELPAATEMASYRIVVEAITNTLRHASASHLTVRMATDNERLVLEIQDDGRGLPASLLPGVGLTSMRERAEGVGGYVDLSPGDAGGTLVRAVLPTGRM